MYETFQNAYFSNLVRIGLVGIIILINFTSYDKFAIAQQQLSNSTAVEILNAQSQAFLSIFQKVQPSVVQISFSPIVNGSVDSNFTVEGSGFVYRNDGYIITNNHVVNGAPNGLVQVTFSDGNTFTAKVVGTDAYDDIGVLHIVDDYTGENLVPLTLANSSQLQVGQVVIAVGNPHFLTESMTHGIISQLGRSFPAGSAQEGVGFSAPDIIQTDAPINPGNSGGPLLNTKGQVVGITSFGLINTTGLNFAYPSNMISRIAPQIIQTGKYDHAMLGFNGDTITPTIAENFGLARNYKGVIVYNVTQSGPLAQAGVKGLDSQGNRGDIIVAIDGHAINKSEDLDTYLDEHKSPGDTVTLTVDRNGQHLQLHAILQAKPPIQQLPLSVP